jgi:branched-chain amino acid transport system permease protein
MIALVAWLPYTRWGRAMCSIRDNELAAEVVGVPTLSVKIGAFTLCAALGAMGGGLYAAGFSYISPDNFNFSRAIEFLSMVLLGGAQSPFGGVIGTTLLILLPEWLKEMPKSLQFIKDIYLVIYGLAVILIMVFMPQGIWGLLRARFSTRSVMPMPAAKLSFHAKNDAHAVLLQVSGLSKYFGGLRAVDGLDLTVRRGTIHALIGPNGSGKTTTLNLISGIYSPSSGSMHVEDIDVTRKPPHQRAALGLGRTFQNIRLFSSMSVLENVVIGGQRRGNPIQPGERALTQRAHAALAFVGLDDKCADLASQLPYGHQRLVEIARSIAGQPKLLLLDEPAAGLNQTEKGQLVELLRRLRDEHGLTILLIDHDMRLVERVSDVITVLNFGKKIAEGTPTEVLQDPAVIAAYLGDTSGVS